MEKIIVKEVQVPFDVYVDNIVVKEVLQEIEIERFVVQEVLSLLQNSVYEFVFVP